MGKNKVIVGVSMGIQQSGSNFEVPQRPLPLPPAPKTMPQINREVSQVAKRLQTMQGKQRDEVKRLASASVVSVQSSITEQRNEIKDMEGALGRLKRSLDLQKNPQEIAKLNGEINKLEIRLAVAKQHCVELEGLVESGVLAFCESVSGQCQGAAGLKSAQDKYGDFDFIIGKIEAKQTEMGPENKQINDLLMGLLSEVDTALKASGGDADAKAKFDELRGKIAEARKAYTSKKTVVVGELTLSGSRTPVSKSREAKSRPTGLLSKVLHVKVKGIAEETNKTATKLLQVQSEIETRMSQISTDLSGDEPLTTAELETYEKQIEGLESQLQQQKAALLERGSSSTRKEAYNNILGWEAKAEELKEQIDVLKKITLQEHQKLLAMKKSVHAEIASAQQAPTKETAVEIIHQMLKGVSRSTVGSDTTIFPLFVQSVKRAIDVEAKGFLVRSEEEQRLVDDLLQGKQHVADCDQGRLRSLLAKGMVFQIHFGSQTDHELNRILAMLSEENISKSQLGMLISEYSEKSGFHAHKPVYESWNRLEPAIAELQRQTTVLARPGFVAKALQLLSRGSKEEEQERLANAQALRKAIEQGQHVLRGFEATSSVARVALQRSESVIAEFDKAQAARLGRDFNQAK